MGLPMWDLLINLLASAIVGVAVWVTQRLLQLRKLARKQAFFGASPGDEVLLFVAKHHSSPRENSVHRSDVACLIELASAIRDCGGTPTLLTSDENRPQAGRVTEYSIGGPLGNPRTAAYLRTDFPGVRFVDDLGDSGQMPFFVGASEFHRAPGREEFVLLARTQGAAPSRPTFLLMGQTAKANLAAARLLSERYVQLSRDYPAGRSFCLLLRIMEPAAFGPDRVEIVGDLTLAAQTPVLAEQTQAA
jgi:hypothetical protein